MAFLNVPNKLLEVDINNLSPLNPFPFPNGADDPYWQGGSNPKPYRWRAEISVKESIHGSHLTREPFLYNGIDIFVGDWLARTTSGSAYKIISVEEKTDINATIILEDVFRYITFRTELGNAIPGNGASIIFQLSEDGQPLIDPIPTAGIGASFLPNLQSRFKTFHERNIFELTQTNHSFAMNDLIAMNNNGDFVVANSGSFDKLVGRVIDIGPGPDKFIVDPFNEIHEDILPALPGMAGDLIYVDETTGELTTTITPKPVYLQLFDPLPTTVTGIEVNPTLTSGDELKINGTVITFSGTTLTTTVSDINAATTSTGVTASEEQLPTSTTTDTTNLSLAYGAIGAFTDANGPEITLNGVTVQLTTTTDGSGRFNDPTIASGIDFATDINNAGIPNIEAEAESDNSALTVRDLSGNSITITNEVNDANGTPWAGASSSTAIPLSTSSSSNFSISLSQADGGPITLFNETGTPKADLGIESAQNGRPPAGLVVEQGIRRGDTFVVADITARDALTPLIGDQAYVLDSGQGEWTLYIWDGSQWVQLTDEDASDVDAQTLSVDVNYDDTSPILIGGLSDGARVTSAVVKVNTPWDDTAASLTVGDSSVNNRFMPSDFNDLTVAGTYTSSPAFQYDTGGTETEVSVFFNSASATQGSATVTITYT